jgi:hypothetical protein
MGDRSGRYLPVNDCLWKKKIPQVRIVERRGGYDAVKFSRMRNHRLELSNTGTLFNATFFAVVPRRVPSICPVLWARIKE